MDRRSRSFQFKGVSRNISAEGAGDADQSCPDDQQGESHATMGFAATFDSGDTTPSPMQAPTSSAFRFEMPHQEMPPSASLIFQNLTRYKNDPGPVCSGLPMRSCASKCHSITHCQADHVAFTQA